MKEMLLTICFLAILTNVKSQQFGETIVVRSGEYTYIWSTILESIDYRFVKKIEVVDENMKTVYASFLTEISTNRENEPIKKQVEANSFTGAVRIMTKNETVVTWTYTDGKRSEPEWNIAEQFGSCTFKIIHNCVTKRIDEMDTLKFILCCFTADECYAALWAKCFWDVCFPKKG